MRPMPSAGLPPPALEARLRPILRATSQLPLARDRVRYAGEPVAIVIARSRAEAEDAAELVNVEYEPLPAIIDTEAAATAAAPRLFPDWPDNVVVRFTHAIGDDATTIRTADVVVHERFRVHRYTGVPLECHGLVCDPHSLDGRLTIWSATQFPHFVQGALAAALGWPAHRIRVGAPDVGGGFGVKARSYAEEIVVPLVALRLGKPVQ